MERLTKREKDGLVHYIRCFAEPCLGCGCKNEVCELQQQICEKLAAYEDAGLTPEEIVSLNTFVGSQMEHLMLELQKEQKKHRWIPAGEQLPEPGTEVLACIKHNYAEDGWRAYRVYEYTDHWVGMGNLCDVIAWMPLPEPYRPEALRSAT